MRTRRRNWIIKRIALGFAVAALAAPAAAQARVDEGLNGQPNKATELTVNSGSPSGMPSAGLNDYLKARDGIEVVRAQPRNTVSADIENVRLNPRGSGSTVEASPSFNWGDAGIGAGLGIALLLAGGAAFFATRHVGRAQTA